MSSKITRNSTDIAQLVDAVPPSHLIMGSKVGSEYHTKNGTKLEGYVSDVRRWGGETGFVSAVMRDRPDEGVEDPYVLLRFNSEVAQRLQPLLEMASREERLIVVGGCYRPGPVRSTHSVGPFVVSDAYLRE